MKTSAWMLAAGLPLAAGEMAGHGLYTGAAEYPGLSWPAACGCLLLACAGLFFYRSVALRRWLGLDGDELAPRRAVGLLPGAASGAAFIGACFLVILGCGGYTVRPGTGPSPGAWGGLIALVVNSAVFQELLFRGVILRGLTRGWGVHSALVVSSAIFGLIHLPNSHANLWAAVALAIGAGLLMGALSLATGSLWVCIGFHAAWNLSESLLGVPVSGMKPYGLITVEAIGPNWLTGGAFGLEASVVAVALGALLSAVLLAASRGHWSLGRARPEHASRRAVP